MALDYEQLLTRRIAREIPEEQEMIEQLRPDQEPMRGIPAQSEGFMVGDSGTPVTTTYNTNSTTNGTGYATYTTPITLRVLTNEELESLDLTWYGSQAEEPVKKTTWKCGREKQQKKTEIVPYALVDL